MYKDPNNDLILHFLIEKRKINAVPAVWRSPPRLWELFVVRDANACGY